MTDQIDIADLRAKLAAATPGPWKGQPEYATCYLPEGEECAYAESPLRNVQVYSRGEYGVSEDAVWHEHEEHDVHLISAPDGCYVAGNYDYEAGGIVHKHDAELIVAAVNALPALLDEIERLRGALSDITERELHHFEVEEENARLRAVTDEQVEAAARAMFAEEQCDPTQKATAEVLERNWRSRLGDEDRAEYRALARAALEAARQAGGGERRFLDLAAQFPVDPELLRRIDADDGQPLPLGHHFVGVSGHPDDDECTFRGDGTDATYCGETEMAHYPEEG